MAIVANEVPNVRYDPYSAERVLSSTDAQVITLGSQFLGVEVPKKLVDNCLGAEFKGGRSAS